MSLTTDRNNPDLGKTRPDGQQEAYLILSEDERKKGFVRPLRRSYVHVGRKLVGKVRPLTSEERLQHAKEDYAAFEEYPPDRSPVVGRYLTSKQAASVKNGYVGGCDGKTVMGLALCETYARDPKFYGSTFCCGCHEHFPIDEFIWEEDGYELGT